MIKFLIKSVIFVVLFLNFTAAKPRFRRLVGGHSAIPNSAQYVVSLQIDGVHLCSGAIVSENKVLTTAYCALQNPETILAGTHKIVTNLKRYEIESIQIHENYSIEFNLTGIRDLAIIKIKDVFIISSNIQIIGLTNERIDNGIITETYGWGNYIDNEEDSHQNDIQVLYQKYLDFQNCRQLYVDKFLPRDVICAFIQKGQAACYGDMGNPLVSVKDQKLVGLLTWIASCDSGKPDVFIDVYKHRVWINAAINSQ